jgi:hypothetical protein
MNVSSVQRLRTQRVHASVERKGLNDRVEEGIEEGFEEGLTKDSNRSDDLNGQE